MCGFVGTTVKILCCRGIILFPKSFKRKLFKDATNQRQSFKSLVLLNLLLLSNCQMLFYLWTAL